MQLSLLLQIQRWLRLGLGGAPSRSRISTRIQILHVRPACEHERGHQAVPRARNQPLVPQRGPRGSDRTALTCHLGKQQLADSQPGRGRVIRRACIPRLLLLGHAKALLHDWHLCRWLELPSAIITYQLLQHSSYCHILGGSSCHISHHNISVIAAY